MKKILTLCFALFTAQFVFSQTLYFPPLSGAAWETLSPDSLGWCDANIDSLYDYLEGKNTKAFIVLKNGRIVLEKYFGTFQQDSVWYWASAGKSATAAVVGIAQAEGLLDISDPTADYLGQGWTSVPPEKEALITIRHQLTMTTGLDDGTGDADCTDPACLQYLADAGTRWAYHNAPYTLLDKVVEAATGQSFNAYFNSKIKFKTGMKGLWLPVGFNNVYFSDARSMARYGLLIQNNGYWENLPVIFNGAFLQEMLNTSQDLNKSYGYLWWLNGKESYRVPGLQLEFDGPLNPNAPDDMVAALGKNGQFLNISPGEGLVFVRMGNSPEGGLFVPWLLNDEIWKRINQLACDPTGTDEEHLIKNVSIYPNPAGAFLYLEIPPGVQDFIVEIFDQAGRKVSRQENLTTINLVDLKPGIYHCQVKWAGGIVARRFVKKGG
jgi:CubicO group peptidase (beta-lactamase class C family)